MISILLASGSRGRYEVLSKAGFDVVVSTPDVDETLEGNVGVEELVSTLAARKADAVMNRSPELTGKLPVVAADTVGWLEGEVGGKRGDKRNDKRKDNKILTKPRDVKDAREMLTLLRGGWHCCVTGYTVNFGGRSMTGTCSTRVLMRPFLEVDLDMYLDSGEWKGKAGAYAIQGLGGVLVERIEGDYFNVCGLPLSRVWQALWELGAVGGL